MRRLIVLLLALGGVMASDSSALAACAGTFLQASSIEDCLDQIPPASALQPEGIGRSWSGRNLAVMHKQQPQETDAAVNLWVNFAFNSADLTTDARITLDELAKALRGTRLASKRFILAGHTDAVGTSEYNQALSERRANSVRTYLIEQGQVSSDRLSTEGWGFSRPLNSQDPKAAENRRVEVKVVQ
jgi:outer membrane protein OmpA-like peptidoglycan-associated protein